MKIDLHFLRQPDHFQNMKIKCCIFLILYTEITSYDVMQIPSSAVALNKNDYLNRYLTLISDNNNLRSKPIFAPDKLGDDKFTGPVQMQ